MMKFFRYLLLLATVVIIFGSGFYIARDIFGKEDPAFTPTDSRFIDDTLITKLSLTEAIMEKFEAKKELITLEVELSEIAEWDDSWGSFDIFSKSQQIRFYGTGFYISDLNLITAADIISDEERRTVQIFIQRPVIKSVTINEEKTEYEDVKKGWLRFGEVKITPEQHNLLVSSVKEKMELCLHTPAIYDIAEEKTLTAVTEIFQAILDSIGDNYRLTVLWRS